MIYDDVFFFQVLSSGNPSFNFKRGTFYTHFCDSVVVICVSLDEAFLLTKNGMLSPTNKRFLTTFSVLLQSLMYLWLPSAYYINIAVVLVTISYIYTLGWD
jgi:hypothetical protein